MHFLYIYMISKVGTSYTVLTSVARLSLLNIHVTGVKIQPGIKLWHPVPKTTYHSAGKLAIQFTNLHSCILILCRKVVIYEQYEKNWIQIIRGSQTKHTKLWRLSKTKSCLGGDVRSIKTQCHNYPVPAPRRALVLGWPCTEGSAARRRMGPAANGAASSLPAHGSFTITQQLANALKTQHSSP